MEITAFYPIEGKAAWKTERCLPQGKGMDPGECPVGTQGYLVWISRQGLKVVNLLKGLRVVILLQKIKICL